MGGHLLSGHVDGLARVVSFRRRGETALLSFEVPASGSIYLAPKGSIALDGVSLTVATCRGKRAEVALIPFTLQHTTLGRVRVGSRLNLEYDILAKYVRAALRGRPAAQFLLGSQEEDE